jgi:hypothetical protein
LRSTRKLENSKKAKELIDTLSASGIEPEEIYKKAYGNIMNSPYEVSKREMKDISDLSDPQDTIAGITGNLLTILTALIGSYHFLYSYLDIIYMPVSSNKSTSIKAVMTQKYPLLDDEGNEKVDEEGNTIFSKKRVANSNTLKFLNERYIEKQEYNELVLNILDEQKEFFVYEENCQIENSKFSEKIRTLQVELPTGQEINNLKITWKLPLTNSMIDLPISNDNLKNYQDGHGGYYNDSGEIKKSDTNPGSFNYYPNYDKLTEEEFLSNIYYSGNTLFIVYEYDKNINDSEYLSLITK